MPYTAQYTATDITNQSIDFVGAFMNALVAQAGTIAQITVLTLIVGLIIVLIDRLLNGLIGSLVGTLLRR